METKQPVWELVAQLGDASPVDYGGYFIYRDATGVYAPEAELLEAPADDEAPEGWTVYRFTLERCTLTDGVLSDNKYHPHHAAWFAKPESEKAERPQDTTYLSRVAEYVGIELDTLRAMFCSDDIRERAEAYRCVGEYHGYDNLDSYPLHFTSRAEVEARYIAKVQP